MGSSGRPVGSPGCTMVVSLTTWTHILALLPHLLSPMWGWVSMARGTQEALSHGQLLYLKMRWKSGV